MIAEPVMEPSLYELKVASQTYDPTYDVEWNEDVDAWTTRFVDHYNKDDTIDYMFNSKEKAEELLLGLSWRKLKMKDELTPEDRFNGHT